MSTTKLLLIAGACYLAYQWNKRRKAALNPITEPPMGDVYSSVSSVWETLNGASYNDDGSHPVPTKPTYMQGGRSASYHCTVGCR